LALLRDNSRANERVTNRLQASKYEKYGYRKQNKAKGEPIAASQEGHNSGNSSSNP
jgi:hypothetical protein